MIRVLTMIAIAGFVLSVAALSAAVAIGGPEAIARGGWNMFSRDWDWDWDNDDGGHHGRHRHHDHEWSSDLGPSTTRVIVWDGGSRLDLDLAADVKYVQTPGTGSVEVIGPAELVKDVQVADGHIRLDHSNHGFYFPKMTIVVHAPSVTDFDVSGANSLTIENYKQSSLRIDASGTSEIAASGEADSVTLDLSGSSRADLGALKSRTAKAEVTGVARTTLAPSESADLDVSGMGDVRLLTHPPKLTTDVSGGGKIREPGASATPAPAPAPSPPVPPSPSKKKA